VDAPRGSEQNFAPASDVIAKFQKLTGRRLSRVQSDRIVDLVLSLDTLPNVAPLIAALST